MKLTDYVIQFLAERGVRHVFGLTGGAVVHLFDSAARSGKIQPIFHHHEQAAAFAAQAYARAKNGLGACFVTTGPGATNAITGLAAAWLDSVPCIYLSGQTRLSHTTRGKKVRQIGTQQLDIIEVVRSMTKYAVMIEDSAAIRYHLEKAYHLATSGRPGPVWIDLPLDLQWADIEPSTLKSFTPEIEVTNHRIAPRSDDITTCLKWIASSQRPLVLAGYGIDRAGARKEFADLVHRLKLPFVTTWGAADVLPTDDVQNLGRPGVAGQRGANLAIQNCDLLICIGSHLCIPVTGTMFEAFARSARIIMVDIDDQELEHRTIRVDLPIRSDAKIFIEHLLRQSDGHCSGGSPQWLEACRSYREKSLALPSHDPGATGLNPYQFVKTLSDHCTPGDMIVVDGGGTNVYVSFQAFQLKRGQRMLLSTALCSMGSGLPESIGACMAGGSRTICLCGDGSLQLNIQELQTIKHHNLPIKIFVSNNKGYVSIRETQREFLERNYVGSSAEGGMSLPDYLKIAAAYGIKALRIDRMDQLAAGIAETLTTAGPVVCEIVTSPVQEIVPRQGFDRNADGKFSPRPLEDMAPFMDREEFAKAMLIPVWSGSAR